MEKSEAYKIAKNKLINRYENKDYEEELKYIHMYGCETVDMIVDIIMELSEGNQSNSEPANCAIFDVNNWVACDDRLPEHLQTVWLANKEKQWVCLGCLVDTNEGWHWAESNGVIYVDEGKIVSECESDDLDVTHWCALPKPPCC